jgi:hypothetical protein
VRLPRTAPARLGTRRRAGARAACRASTRSRRASTGGDGVSGGGRSGRLGVGRAYPVGQECIAGRDRGARRVSNALPAVGLLRDGAFHVVVAVEWLIGPARGSAHRSSARSIATHEERRELHPAVAQSIPGRHVSPIRRSEGRMHSLLIRVSVCNQKCQRSGRSEIGGRDDALNPHVSGPTIGIWNSWNCSTPWIA